MENVAPPAPATPRSSYFQSAYVQGHPSPRTPYELYETFSQLGWLGIELGVEDAQVTQAQAVSGDHLA